MRQRTPGPGCAAPGLLAAADAGPHRLGFEGGRIELLLGLGNARELLRELVLQADAFYLDGFAPARNPQLWDAYLFKALARLAAPAPRPPPGAWRARCGTGWQATALPSARRPASAAGRNDARRLLRPTTAPCSRRAGKRRARDARDAREAIVLGAGLAGAARWPWLTKAWPSP